MDPSTRYRLRCDLLQGLGDPFDGRAEFFSQWYTTLNKRILECGQECDSLDAINIIIANTAGEVKETVKRLLSAGISDPDCTLSRIWETIHERFGSTDDLSDSLINQLENLKAVGNVTDIKGLHNVLDTCSIVESHMLVYPDLRFLNFKRGLQIVLDVLPERIRTRWKERSFQYRNNTGIDADFSFLVQFLVNECKFWRAQAPAGSVSKSTKTPYIGTQNKKQYKTNNTKLDTDNKHSKTVEKKPKFCQFHQFSGHSIDECFGFEQEHYATRKRFAGDKNLCYTCLGSHRAQDCDVKPSIKCRVCGSSHVTAMHRGPIPRSPRAGRPSGGTIPSHRYRQVSAKGSESTSRDYHDYGGSTSRQQRDATRDHEGAAAARAPSQDRGSGFKHQYEAGGAYGPVIDAKNNCITVCGSKSRSNVCSKTLLVDIAHESKPGSLRALCIVDEQSNAYFCDPSIVKYFGIAATQEDYDLDTMNGKFTYKGESIRGLRVKGAFSGEYHSLPAVLTHPEIPNNKGEVATTRIIEAHPHLSYYASYFPHSVDEFDVLLLIGANCGELMFSTSWGDHAPYIHQTPLGLAVVGPVCTSESQPLKALRTSITPTSGKLCTMQRRFVPQYNKEKLTCPFETRDDDDLPAMSQENIVFYDILKESIGVNEAGNIQMDLPIKPNAEIPKNKWPVFYRTKNTLSRLKRKGKELQSCLKVMSEYLEAGHFEQVGAVETTSKLVNHIHIFPVYNESKDKTRLVFNSAAAIHGKSLNSVLLPGIDEGSKLLGVLLRFRIGEYGFSADIEKMFHSFHVSEEFRDLLRFWWFRDNDPSKDLVEYRAKVMIFGNRTSPACANFGIQFAAGSNIGMSKPSSSQLLQDNMYVDDLVASKDTVDDAVEALTGCVDILAHYNIRLHKFSASDKRILHQFPETEWASTDVTIQPGEYDARVLGIRWCSENDTLSLSSTVPTRPFTKRGLLAVIHSVYDPLGWCSPCLLTAKLLQREIMPAKRDSTTELESYDWDDVLPEKYFSKWSDWLQSLQGISNIIVPRCYKGYQFGEVAYYEVHTFSDASKHSIGHCVYLRTVGVDGKLAVSLVYGSSKVSPRSAETIPRLELCAAMDAVLSTVNVVKELGLQVRGIYFYTDSRIVLGYLRNISQRFSRYVARRVEEILRHSNVDQWFHVSGKHNVGDIATKPHSPEELLKTDWLVGPEFLREGKPIPSGLQVRWLWTRMRSFRRSSKLKRYMFNALLNRRASLKRLVKIPIIGEKRSSWLSVGFV